MLHLISMVAKKGVSTKDTRKETRKEWKHVTTKKINEIQKKTVREEHREKMDGD